MPQAPERSDRPNAATAVNDVTSREGMWRRFRGDDWAAFDSLPPAVRRRLQEHAYDGWAVNAVMKLREFRLKKASSALAERAMLRFLDECESLEREAFDAEHRQRHGAPLPHVAANATVVRYRAA